jgi:hypothetical protein
VSRRSLIFPIVFVLWPSTLVHAANDAGVTADATDHSITLDIWNVGAVNGGQVAPPGAICTAWEATANTTPESGAADIGTVRQDAAGIVYIEYFRLCDGVLTNIWVPQLPSVDLATIASDHIARLLPDPVPSFAPPIDKMIVNFETWMAVAPLAPVTATVQIPGSSATATATPVSIEWATGSTVFGDVTKIVCKPWGSIAYASNGCTWTPAYPSVPKVTGTDDLHYHGSMTVVWHVDWSSSSGAGGTLNDLRTTTPLQVTVMEIQTIGG